MRRLGARGGATALFVGLGLAVAAARGAENFVQPPPTGDGLLSGLFHEKPKSPRGMDKTPTAAAPHPVNTVESATADQQRYMNALIRRMEVCDRLRMIANQTRNETLMNQANELEERANAIYRRQTAGLPLPAQAPASVLADERENLGSERQGPQPRANGRAPYRSALGPRPSTKGSGDAGNIRRAPAGSSAGLGGSLDQREQAILEGTSMGEN